MDAAPAFPVMRCRTALLALLLALSACGASEAPAVAAGDAVEPGPVDGPDASDLPRDCFWAARSDPNAVNTLYPDRYATYWSANLNIPPGGAVLLRGRYPHARYMSFNLYNPRLEPLDALADVEINPLPGAVQPFAVNAQRAAEPRDYEIQIIAALRPDDPALRAPNTLYSFQAVGAQPVPGPQATVLYRIYVEDAGYDLSGGVGLPQVVLRYASGQEVTGTEACSAMELAPAVPAADSLNTLNPATEVPANTAAFEYLQWLKFFDLQGSQANRFNATPAGQAFRTTFGNSTSNAGGFASNVHNNYVYSTLSQSLGEVVAIEARFPQAPRTRNHVALMQGGDLRYWSLCTYDANSQRYFDCLYDEQVTRNAGQRAIVVVSRPADRPQNATPACGVTWLNWGPLSLSLLIYRHMLPEPGFAHAIQAIPGPPGEHEEAVMGDYFPYGQHLSRTAFEALGCPVPGAAIADLSSQP